MSERDRIANLTRLAFFDAIVLSFLAVQFVVPFLFLLLLGLMPALFALMIYRGPMQTCLLAVLVVLVIAFGLLGLDMGLWAFAYAWVGGVLGIGWRLKLSWLPRVASTALAFALSLGGIFLLFSRIAGVSWSDLAGLLEQAGVNELFPMTPVIIIGLTTWAVILAAVANGIVARVAPQFSLEVT